MTRYDCSRPDERAAGIAAAVAAVRAGSLVVLPTDTVYGLGADAFSPAAVDGLLAAKGRGRDIPSPVLIGRRETLQGLAVGVPGWAHDLVDAFWPGALTIVVRHGPSLSWDLGETRGTVAVRMPLHPVALDLLAETGPMAVSSANVSGAPPATTAAEAEWQLGGAVAVYLEAGRGGDPVPSTIVDCTGEAPRVLRAGAVPVERLREVVPTLDDAPPPPPGGGGG